MATEPQLYTGNPSMVDTVCHLAEAQPDAPALTVGDVSLTRAALVDRTRRVAGAFAAAGVKEGSVVTIGLPNSVEFVVSTLACWWLGATPQPISHSLVSAERRAIIDLAAPDLLVGVSTEDASGRPVIDVNGLDVAPANGPAPNGEVSVPWKIMASGGSTGRPKLIMDTRPAVTSLMAGGFEMLRLRPEGCLLVTGPMAHNGPFLAASFGLLLGKHVVVMRRFDAAEALALVGRHRVDWIYLVPSMMHRIWQLPAEQRNAADVSSLEVAYHMGAPCPPLLKRAWMGWLGPSKVLELYGGTEGQAVTLVGGEEWLTRPGTVGRVVAGEMQVRDPDGVAVPAGTIGELWLRPGRDIQPLYRYVGAVARSAPGNWESLGDIGMIDAEGYVYITDRRADMILVGGSNVYPAEIEAALDEHPLVRSSCVIGIPHPDLGNAPYALVELGGDVLDSELLAHLEQRIAVYKLPRWFERVDCPLRDDAGKVRRSGLRAERLSNHA
jgi:bile acid-coenzyme A ligase